MKKNYSNNILATLCYIVCDDSVLMIHRVGKKNDIHHNKYNGLGGKLEEGESPYDCVIREIKEESGISIKNPVFKGILNFPCFDGKNNWIVFVYVAKVSSKRFESDLREGVLEWVKKKDLLNLNLWEGDKIFLEKIFDKNFFYGTFYYKNNRLLKHSFRLIKNI